MRVSKGTFCMARRREERILRFDLYGLPAIHLCRRWKEGAMLSEPMYPGIGWDGFL